MKKHLILGFLSLIVMLGSCKKDKNSNTAEIQGTYKLKYLTSKTSATATGSTGDKSVTTSDYTTINNQGTLVFDNSNLTATGLTYTVDTDAKYSLYQDNQFIDSSSYPFTFTLPASNSMAAYQLIGADSIYFPLGSLTSGVGGTGSIQSGASGGRYSLTGNLLTLTQIASKDSTFVDSGETIHLTESAVSSVVMEKQ
jgi:hypothetical protein